MCLCMRCAQEQDARHSVEVQMYVSVSVYALVFVCLCVCLLSVSLCLCMRCAQEQDARHGVDASGSSQSSALCPGALVQMALQCKL